MDPYRDNIEHLTDELKRVDLLIQRALAISRDQPQQGQEYRGLLISEPEIDELLKTGEFLSQHWHKQEKNQRKLDALDKKLVGLRKTIDERRELTTKTGRRLTLSHLAERFGLSSAEVDLLLVAMAPELEPRYETLYAYLQDDVTRKRPSADLALNMICRSEREKLFARRFLAPGAPLIHFRVLELLEESHDRQPTLLRKFLKIEDSVLRFLLEHATRLALGSFEVPQQTIHGLEIDEATRTQLHNLADSVQRSGSKKTIVRVVGSDRAELQEAAAAFYDSNIAANNLRITCEETFPSSSPNEIAHILVLRSRFDNGVTSTVRGIFTYRVNDSGLLTSLRGYWNMDVMHFGQAGKGD